MKTPTDDSPSSTSKQHPPSRRAKSSSFSSWTSSPSSSPSSSSNPNSPFCNGIPFSWEQQPGIPKRPNSPFSNSNRHVILPLPPASISTTVTPKKKHQESLISAGSDPFVTALMECSRDQHRDPEPHRWNGSRVSRTMSDRLGFIDLYASCKSTCSVADSHVLQPRSNRASYDLLNRRA
ncbi:hypothetical protein ACLOJK_033277 [Asimina triloba]